MAGTVKLLRRGPAGRPRPACPVSGAPHAFHPCRLPCNPRGCPGRPRWCSVRNEPATWNPDRSPYEV